MNCKVAMMQPAFLPWQGFFELIAKSDKFIFLDDFQYVLRSHHSRNRMFRNINTAGFYTIPVQKSQSFGLPLNQAKPLMEKSWKNKMLHALELNYHRTEYFHLIQPVVKNWLDREYRSLAELNISFILSACRLMNIPDHFYYSSEISLKIGSESKRSRRVAKLLDHVHADLYLSAFGSFDYMREDGFSEICPIPVLFQNHIPKPYPQLNSSDFIPYLSVLDALYNIGPAETLKSVLAGTEKWLTWKEREAMSCKSLL